MTKELFFVHPETPVTEAQAMLRREHIHRLPVIDTRSKSLVGIVTEKDLLYAAPSPATTLNVYEMTNLLSKLAVSKVMTKEVISTGPDELVENAARMMIDANIGGLPVVDGDGNLVGIVTETDVLKLFIEVFGTREPGLRAAVRVSDRPGTLARLGADVVEKGGNVISVGTWPGKTPADVVVILKVSGVDRDALLAALEPDVMEVIDVRET